MEHNIKLYNKTDVIDKIQNTLQEMEKRGLNTWTDLICKLPICIEILEGNHESGISDYVLHLFFYTSDDDMYGTHVFDFNVKTKYNYPNWVGEVSRKFDLEAGV